MKALTLWEPWASLIALGVKRIETRSWQTSYRGPLAIHAAARPIRVDEWNSDLKEIVDRFRATGWKPRYSQFVCVGNLRDIVRVEQLNDPIDPVERACGDYSDGRYGWIIDKLWNLPAPQEEIAGQRGLWTPDPAVPLGL